MIDKVTIPYLRQKKKNNQKISMLTAYDYPTAQMLDQAGIEILLVGDTLGMVVLGYENTLPVTMEEMLHHARAVCRGRQRALVVGDMPFMSFHLSIRETIYNAGRFIKEAGAEAVKLEWIADAAEKTRALTDAGISVMGHVGLTPQMVHHMGGFKVQGRDEEAATKLLEEARLLQDAGAFAIVLEGIPAAVAKKITQSLNILTIGIGAGADCDGQVLVTNDLLGLNFGTSPKFVKKYAELKSQIIAAASKFREEVTAGEFPSEEYWYK
jgi:3-methyl-2-oxobutanoate hydroxymethyltransferase